MEDKVKLLRRMAELEREQGGLDEYHEAPVAYDASKPAFSETGGYTGEANGYDDDEDGGYEDDEDGGYLDEDGGYDDDEEGNYEDEEGGFDGTDSINRFIEEGGKKKKRRKIRLFRRKKKKKKSRRPTPQASAIDVTSQRAMDADRCAQLGYGTLELAKHNVPMSAGLPYVSVSSGLRIIEAPIPLENRIRPGFLKPALVNTALRTSHTPVNSTVAPPAGPFTLNVNGALGTLNEVIGLALDIGPQPLNTQAGAIMSVKITGKYVDGDAADLGFFKFGLPSTTSQMRIVFFFYVVQNGAPRPKMMFAANGYTTPYQAAVDPVVTPIVVSGDVPAGLFLSATLLGPSQPTYENLLAALTGAGCC